jgi:hypothetical protein
MFPILGIITLSLHLYNKSQDEKREEELKQARLSKLSTNH